MEATTKELVIKTAAGETVGRVNLKEGVLDGHCAWYDGRGELVAYGFFKDGAPLPERSSTGGSFSPSRTRQTLTRRQPTRRIG
jgi:hypothetical protein